MTAATTITAGGVTTIQDLFPYNWDLSGWTSNVGSPAPTSTCSETIVGGYNNFGSGAYAQRTYSGLTSHNSVILSIRLYFVDSWDGEKMQIYVDDKLVYEEFWNFQWSGLPSYCGSGSNSWADQVFDRELDPIEHTGSTLKLKITSNLGSGANDESFGFNSVQIRLSNCHYTCYTCSGTGSNQCTSCPVGKYLTSTYTCVSDCSTPYIKDPTTGKCIKCFQYVSDWNYQTCATCQGPYSTNCLTCTGSNYFNSATGACTNPCPQGTYPDSGSKTCKPCYSPSTAPSTTLACATCDGGTSTNCVTCVEGTYLFTDGTCRLECPDGYYANSTTYPKNECAQCYSAPDGPCTTCNGGASNNCLTCDTPFYYDPTTSKCVLTCPVGYWEDSSSHTCIKCYTRATAAAYQQTCYTCTNSLATSCTSCAPGEAFLFSTNGTCLLRCPPGYWGDTSDDKCKQCYQYTASAPTENPCATCEGPDSNDCLSCNSPWVLDKTTKTCVDTCPTGYFNDAASLTCIRCYVASNPTTDVHKSCKSCSGILMTNCLSCEAGNYYYPRRRVCLGSCPSGYYADDATSTCLPCYSTINPIELHRTCITCSGGDSNNCLSCETNAFYIASENICVNTCPDGYFKDPITNTCITCYSTGSGACQTCTGGLQTDCTSCFTGTYYLPSNTSCVSGCPTNGWYADNDTCKSCYMPSDSGNDKGCLSCKGGLPTDCLSCARGTYYYYTNSTCLFECPYGFYKNNQTSTCSLCTDSSQEGCPSATEAYSSFGMIVAVNNLITVFSSASSILLLGGLTVPSIMGISFPADSTLFIFLYVSFPDNYVRFTRSALDGQSLVNPFPYMRGPLLAPKNSSTTMFSFWQINTALFENSGIPIFKAATSFIVIIVFSVLAFLFRNNHTYGRFLKRVRDTFKWNVLLSFLLQDFSNLMLGGMLQMKENASENTYVSVSMGIATIVVIMYSLLIPYFWYLLNKKKKITTKVTEGQEEEETETVTKIPIKIPESMKILNEGFKDNYWINRNFTLIFIVQNLWMMFTVFFVQQLGVVAPAMFSTITLLYLVVLIGFRPIKSKLKFGVVIFNQVVRITMGAMALALGMNQDKEFLSQEAQTNIGVGLIILSLTGSTIDAIVSLVLLTVALFELLTTYTRRKKKIVLDLPKKEPEAKQEEEKEKLEEVPPKSLDVVKVADTPKSGRSARKIHGLTPVYPGSRKYYIGQTKRPSQRSK